MLHTIVLLGFSACLQVPPPPTGRDLGSEIRATGQGILDRESTALIAIAEGRKVAGDPAATAELRALAVRGARGKQGASRLYPLPDMVPPRGQGLASIASRPRGSVVEAKPPTAADGWRKEVDGLRTRSAGELFDLANRAAGAQPPHYAQANILLRAVLDRQPDHREARRLLGYVPHEGGWARPFTVRQLRDGSVDHPVFGWVPADWVPHLESGELPAPPARGQKRARWLPAAEADRLHADVSSPWKITTEHFEIQSNVPLAEVIRFGRKLEAFYDLFFTLMADVVGDALPLARRYRSPGQAVDTAYRLHQVYYFAAKNEYLQHLRRLKYQDIEETLGFYYPPRPGKGNRAPAYFFRDRGGQVPIEATLYHEVSHQLLFESAGTNGYMKNAGNYWVFEGMGTYFETVNPLPDGSIEVGGPHGPRIEEAIRSAARHDFIPLEAFVRLDMNAFNRPERIHVNYQQAMALTVFLMQADDARYRESFLDYVRDAYRGRLRTTTGRSLDDRLGRTCAELEAPFRRFLKESDPGPAPARLKDPGPR